MVALWGGLMASVNVHCPRCQSVQV
ncbi:hypothetical protein DUD99_02420 [Salmonella enterica subsp. enterica]|uniref:InsA N-terminal zinc ribbon domain-containing protein n=2 Tax=Salmonella enterica TaxID=28901 RepID=A0A5Z8BN84_SALER|nr:hypothetical protein [Salmonella enterica subsp. enterica]EAM2910030.1 hypothetical protein [Salmonella enterica]EBZ5927558.1 hypothetical protein [Salmonella enterica subsp. enterica serovar Weslaco]EBZ6046091.1 hypothetical protein [Salmonella enterica subsp. enterica serovar Texas]EDP9255629.1 hypothetical protein [Salmonella enterica subsp. enterica serovar Newmexico]EDU6321412.1 hypothetical protein [Salmonella enterica subsp. enterica serovar Edinburgh]